MLQIWVSVDVNLSLIVCKVFTTIFLTTLNATNIHIVSSSTFWLCVDKMFSVALSIFITHTCKGKRADVWIYICSPLWWCGFWAFLRCQRKCLLDEVIILQLVHNSIKHLLVGSFLLIYSISNLYEMFIIFNYWFFSFFVRKTNQ